MRIGQSIVEMNDPILLHIGSPSESDKSLASIFPKTSYFISDFDVEEKEGEGKKDGRALRGLPRCRHTDDRN